MDGVERVMVLGIFIVIVLILGVLAWDATHEEPQVAVALGEDGGSQATAAGLNDREPFAAGIPRSPRNGESLADAHRRSTQGEQAPRTPRRSGGRDPKRNAQPEGPSAETAPSNQPEGEAVALGGTVPLKAAAPRPLGPRTYTVSEGDTAWKIAYDQFGEGDRKQIVEAIQALNPTVDLDQIRPGMVLKLPAEAPAEAKLPSADELVAAGEGRFYKVQSGDTLRGIAAEQLHDAKRWKDVYDANRHLIDSPNRLAVGMVLALPEE